MLPALTYAEHDRMEGRLSPSEEQSVIEATRELLDELAARSQRARAGADSASVGQGVANVADAVAASSIWSAAAALGDIIQIVVTPTGAFTGTLSVKGK